MTNKQKKNSIANHLEYYLHPKQKVLLALSGGIDSMVLLHLLVKLKKAYSLELRAIHVHHGLSKHADQWTEHCEQYCKQWHVPLTIARLNIDNNNNIEAKAREARYAIIKQHLLKNEIVMTGHHLDDQCETFLLALKRGSGPTGLASMKAVSDFNHHELIRPFLSLSQNEIVHYANEHQLKWIEDDSNLDRRYDRNFLRLTILPLLIDRWPHFPKMVSRSAELCTEETQLIAELLTDELTRCMDNDNNLTIPPLLSMSILKRNAIIRAWLKHHRIAMPSRRQLNLLWETVVMAKADSSPQFRLQSFILRRFKQKLYIVTPLTACADTILPWDLNRTLPLPNNLGYLQSYKTPLGPIRCPTQHELVTIRFQATGTFTIVGRQGSRSIKKLWQEFGIPPWMRSQTPLVYYNDRLIAAVGIFVTHEGYGNDMTITLESKNNEPKRS